MRVKDWYRRHPAIADPLAATPELLPDLGLARIGGTTLLPTLRPASAYMGGPSLERGGVRYVRDGEIGYGMIERSAMP